MIKRPLMCVCLGVAVLLYLSVSLGSRPDSDYSEYQGKRVTVRGKVYWQERAARANGEAVVLYIRTEDTGPGDRVVCYLKEGQPEVEMGCRVGLSGKLSCFERASNPGQFDTYSYYQISGISYRIYQAEITAKTKKYNRPAQALYRLRRFLSEKIGEALPEKEASVMQTMLLGEKGGMDKELKALYQRNGIAHILAISGLHVSMLGMGFYRLLRKLGLPMKASACFSSAMMLLYGMMTGFSVSALRAILMFALQMGAVLWERTYDMLTAAAFAAALILLQKPLYFFHSGFVFSFGCVFGIGLVLPVLTGGAKKHSLLSALQGGIGIAVITLPIYLWFYYQYPLCSILLNLVVLPLLGLLMGAGLLLIGSRIICPALSLPFSLIIRGVLGFYEGALKLCDTIPGNLFTTGRPEVWQILLYLALLAILVAGRRRIKPLVRWGVVLGAVILLLYRPNGGMEITFLDVGQGDCIFIANENKSCYLVDGGSSTVSGVGQYRMIPFLKYRGVSRLKAVFVTHPDEDHCNGIRELMEIGREHGIRIETLVLPDIAQEAKTEGYYELEQEAAKVGIRVLYVSRGQEISDGKLTLSCLHPEKGAAYADTNGYSTVLRLSFGNFSAMLTGDIEGEGEQRIITDLDRSGEREQAEYSEKNRGNGEAGEAAPPLTVLKVAHHGSAYSTPAEFLDSQRPIYAVISCGKGNSYGHPHKDLLERLADCGARVYQTPESGAVSMRTDGERVQVTEFCR